MWDFSVNWAEVSTTILGSGALFALANVLLESHRSRQKIATEKRFLAVQLATQFEGYAIQGFDAYADHKAYEASGGHAGASLNGLSNIPPLPQVEGYQFLSANLLDRIYQLPQQKTMFERDASGWIDYADDTDEYWKTLIRRHLEMLSMALAIAKDLRREAGLPSRALGLDDWNLKKSLRDEIEKNREKAR